ncbi:MAG: hypothetical protein CM1200mP14_02270 [Gammaproteobacteria bacterium]|nr:MAG: hypothetical protein CM1200mP14_02270 [Gammaproteobacteria bacterium]
MVSFVRAGPLMDYASFQGHLHRRASKNGAQGCGGLMPLALILLLALALGDVSMCWGQVYMSHKSRRVPCLTTSIYLYLFGFRRYSVFDWNKLGHICDHVADRSTSGGNSWPSTRTFCSCHAFWGCFWRSLLSDSDTTIISSMAALLII